MKQGTYAVSVLLGWLLYTSTVSAQTTLLSDDFTLTETTIILPQYLRSDAGYPAWRLVIMKGKDAVPYRYCAWLQNNSPWTLNVFGVTPWQARKNCADGITTVTRLDVDAGVPVVGSDDEFWRKRPVGYQYMVPNHTLSKADFDALMLPVSGADVQFVADAESLAVFMNDAQARLSALEEWQESIEETGGVLTTEALMSWLMDNKFLQSADLPEGILLTMEQAKTLFLQSEVLPEGELLTVDAADKRYLAKSSTDQYVRKGDMPTGTLLTKEAASKLFASKGRGVTSSSWMDWLWLIPLGLLFVLIFLFLVWQRKKPQTPKTSAGDYVKQEDFTMLVGQAQDQTHQLEQIKTVQTDVRTDLDMVATRQASIEKQWTETTETAMAALSAANAAAQDVAVLNGSGLKFIKTPNLLYLNDAATSHWELLVDEVKTKVSFTREGDKWFSDLPRNKDGSGISSPFTNVNTEHVKAKLREAHKTGRLKAHLQQAA